MYEYQGTGKGKGDSRIPMVYLVKDDVVMALFEDQKYDPVNIEEDGIKKYKTYQLEDISIETHFSVLDRSEVMLKNVVGMVRGSDPELSKQFIAVGAHLDHVAFPGGQVANGADDNASYSKAGIPSFFFFSGDHKDLHTPGDDADKIEYDKAVKLSRLAYLITMKLANMDEVPDFLE